MNNAIVNDLRNYSGLKLGSDIIAGLTVAVILIPQGMAYALLAGLDPIYGLYAALVPMIVYPFFASSRQLSVGPVALMSIIVLAGVSVYATPGTQEYLDLVLLTGLMAGLIQVIMSLLKLGRFSNFLSRPVMNGFITAAGLIIAISQLKYILSLDLPRQNSIVNMLRDVFTHFSETNWISLVIGLSGIGIILLLKRINRLIPGALIVVIIGILIIYFFDLNAKGVPIVGDMPKGLPSLYLGFLDFEQLRPLLAPAFVVSLICFIGSYSIAKSMGEKEAKYDISANRELLGLGMAKVLGSFFMSMPSTGSFTRSAINYEAGGKTGLSSIFGAIFIGLTISFFSFLFYYLPEPILAAVVITSVFSLINFREAFQLYKIHRTDFWVFLVTMVSTLILGIVDGIVVGIVLSLLSILLRTSKIYYAVLGILPGTLIYRNLKRYPEAKPVPGVLILRFAQAIYFGNAESFANAIATEADQRDDVDKIVISMPTYFVPDETATKMIYKLIDICDKKSYQLFFTDINGPVRDYMHKTGIYEKLGSNRFFLTIADAIEWINTEGDDENLSNIYSGQTNFEKKNKV